MDKENETIYVTGGSRISAHKQQEGASLEDQDIQIRFFVKEKGWELLHVFSEVYSGRSEIREDFNEVKAYIKSKKEEGVQVRYHIIKSIDRITRGGSIVYQKMKDELKKLGTELIDVRGVIQPEQNSLAHLGFQYGWSMRSPTASAQLAEAEDDSKEVYKILTRMIGAEIVLVQEGYKMRAPNDGFINKRIYVGGKKKKIEIPDPERAHFFRAMFELRAEGLDDKETVDRLNALGYKTKNQNRWNKKKTEIIAIKGGEPLTVKRLQSVIQRPIYAGVKVEKWTNYKPIWAKYEGLVSIEMFNEANRGKIVIKKRDDGSLELLHNCSQFGELKPKRFRNNPDFPYKFFPCSLCKKWMLGSYSRGKSGTRYPAYHCGGFTSGTRAHNFIRFPKDEYEKAVTKFINDLKFTDAMIESFEKILNDVYRTREKEVVAQSSMISNNVGSLKAQQASVLDTLTVTQSPVARKKLEEKIDELELQIQEAETQRNEIEITEKDIKSFIRAVKIIMEHPAKILLDTDDMATQQVLFGLVFEELPTYPEILNGTPKLSLAFKRPEDFNSDKSHLVTSPGIAPEFQA